MQPVSGNTLHAIHYYLSIIFIASWQTNKRLQLPATGWNFKIYVMFCKYLSLDF